MIILLLFPLHVNSNCILRSYIFFSTNYRFDENKICIQKLSYKKNNVIKIDIFLHDILIF